MQGIDEKNDWGGTFYHYLDTFIETALSKRMDEKTTTGLEWIIKKIVLMVDDIFAALSMSYHQRRMEISGNITYADDDKYEAKPEALPEAAAADPTPMIKKLARKAGIDITKSDPELHENFIPHPTPVSDNTNKEITIDNIRYVAQLIKQGMGDFLITALMQEELNKDQCLQLLKELRAGGEEHIDEICQNMSSVDYDAPLPDDLLNQEEDPSDLILSAGGVNQYTPVQGKKLGVSACTPLCCSFLSSTKPATAQMITDLILNNTYSDDDHGFADDWIEASGLKSPSINPWMDQAEFGTTMEVSLTKDDEHGIGAAIKAIAENLEVKGALLTGNAVTTAIRKRKKHLELFDPHGDDQLTAQGNGAFVKKFAFDQLDELTEFVSKKYPDIGAGFAQMQFYPIC